MATRTSEFDHAPGSNLDYSLNWVSWLGVSETIQSSSWTATAGITLSSEQNSSGITSVFAAGGVVGRIYTLTNTIVTSAGRTDSRVIVLSCKVR